MQVPHLQPCQIAQDLLALLVHAQRVLVAFHRLVVVPVLLVHQPACRGMLFFSATPSRQSEAEYHG